jgi:hypothetical protein
LRFRSILFIENTAKPQADSEAGGLLKLVLRITPGPRDWRRPCGFSLTYPTWHVRVSRAAIDTPDQPPWCDPAHRALHVYTHAHISDSAGRRVMHRQEFRRVAMFRYPLDLPEPCRSLARARAVCGRKPASRHTRARERDAARGVCSLRSLDPGVRVATHVMLSISPVLPAVS